jgi:hypothetical protein
MILPFPRTLQRAGLIHLLAAPALLAGLHNTSQIRWLVHVPHLPGTRLHQAWLAQDLASGRLLVVDREGAAEPWLRDEGEGPAARFLEPVLLEVRPIREGEEQLWAAVLVDPRRHAVWRIDAQGGLTVLAGSPGRRGYEDGKAVDARFDTPAAVAWGGDGAVYVADAANACIRMIRDGAVTTLAGSPLSLPGLQDGTGAGARFWRPGAIAVHAATGLVLVCDRHSVRSVTSQGVVKTVAGGWKPGFEDALPGRAAGSACLRAPVSLRCDGDRLGILDQDGAAVRALDLAPGTPGLGALSTLIKATPQGDGKDAPPPDGGEDSGPDVPPIHSGFLSYCLGLDGADSDGPRCHDPIPLVALARVDQDTLALRAGTWLGVDRSGGSILRLSPRGYGFWLGATDPGAPAADGEGPFARFDQPAAIAIRPRFPAPLLSAEDAPWEAVIVDQGSHALRRVDDKAVVTTLAGVPGREGHRDGKAAQALFRRPAGAAYGRDGAVYVADQGNRCIRRIHLGEVTTVAGGPSNPFQDGPAADAGFLRPGAMALDLANGDLYLCDRHAIRVLTESGQVRTVAGPELKSGLTFPSGLALSGGELFIADPGNRAVRVLDLRPDSPGHGQLTTLAGPKELGGEDQAPAALAFGAFDRCRVVLNPVRKPGASRILELTLERGHQARLLGTEPAGSVSAVPWSHSRPGPLEPKAGRAAASSPGDGKSQGGDGKSSRGPAAQPYRPGKERMLIGERTSNKGRPANAGFIANLGMYPTALTTLADGSLVAYHGELPAGTSLEYLVMEHQMREVGLAPHQFVHLYRERPRSNVWRYQVIPCRMAWHPGECRQLRAGPDNTLLFLDGDNALFRLQLARKGASWEMSKATPVYPLDQPASRLECGLPMGEPWIAPGPGGTLALGWADRVSVLPAHGTRQDTIRWPYGQAPGGADYEKSRRAAAYVAGQAPSPAVEAAWAAEFAQEARKGTLQSLFRAPTDAPVLVTHAADGTLFGLDGPGRTAFMVDPGGTRTELATALNWPGAFQPRQIVAQGGALFAAGLEQPDGSDFIYKRFVPSGQAGQLGQVEDLKITTTRLGQLAVTPEGDLMIAEPFLLRIIPNEAWTAQTADPQVEAREREAAEAAWRDLEKELLAEADAAAAKRALAAPAGPEAAAGSAAEDESGTEDDEAGDPFESGSAPAPSSRPAGRPARASRPAGAARPAARYVPVRGDRYWAGLRNLVERFANSSRFESGFNEMQGRHAFSAHCNDHDYKSTGESKARIDRQLRLGAGAVRPGRSDGRFTLPFKTVQKIVRAMLLNTSLANPAEALQAWEQANRPARPGFPFGLYVQDGHAQRANRIVLEIRDLRTFVKRLGLDRYSLEDLAARDYRTGVTERPDQPPAFTYGLRVVLFEGCAGIATVHPCGETTH